MTPRQSRIMQAIEAGHTTVRAIAKAAGISSTSVVAANLQALEADGHVVFERTAKGEQVYTGRDYASAWDSACRLSGNPDA